MRTSGVLMPISSLPSPYGIGTMGKSARKFVDFLVKGGQTYWQILPLGPTSYGDSPYQSYSTFAGNPYFIDLDTLVEEGVLDKKDCEKVNWGKKPDEVDYEKIYKGRYPLLRKAYENSDISKKPDYQKFVAENSWWLSDYALFMPVKDRFEGVEWTKWAEDIRLRWNNAMDYYREELYFDIEFQQYMQFKFYEQRLKLKSFAKDGGWNSIYVDTSLAGKDKKKLKVSSATLKIDGSTVKTIKNPTLTPDPGTTSGNTQVMVVNTWNKYSQKKYKAASCKKMPKKSISVTISGTLK